MCIYIYIVYIYIHITYIYIYMCIYIYTHWICIYIYILNIPIYIQYVYSTRLYAQYNILCHTVAGCIICLQPSQRIQKKSTSQQSTRCARSIAARALSSCTRCAPSAASFPQSAFESFWWRKTDWGLWQWQIDTMYKTDKCRSALH